MANPWMNPGNSCFVEEIIANSAFMNPFKPTAESGKREANLNDISMEPLPIHSISNSVYTFPMTIPMMNSQVMYENCMSTPPPSAASTLSAPILPFDQELFEEMVMDLPEFDDFRNFLPCEPVGMKRSSSFSVEYARPRAPRQRFLSADHEPLGCGQSMDQDLESSGLEDSTTHEFCFPNDPGKDQFHALDPDTFKFISLQELETETYHDRIVFHNNCNEENMQYIETHQTKFEPLSFDTPYYSNTTSLKPLISLTPLLYSCDKCPKEFKKPKDWKRHLDTHKQNSFECQDCRRKFSRKDALTRHIRKLRCICMKRMIKGQKDGGLKWKRKK